MYNYSTFFKLCFTRIGPGFSAQNLQVLCYIFNAILYIQKGLLEVEARVWMAIVNYWLKPALRLGPSNMAGQLSVFMKKTSMYKGSALDFSSHTLLTMGYNQTRLII